MKTIMAVYLSALLVVLSTFLFEACTTAPPNLTAHRLKAGDPTPVVPGFLAPWTQTVLNDIEIDGLLVRMNEASTDMDRFCTGYDKMSASDQATVWVYLMSGIAKYESDYNPTSEMTESDGSVSQGLFQLTYGNAFCPRSSAQANLNDPVVNINCAVQLMTQFAVSDKVIAAGGYPAYGAPPAKGLARYWSVLRVPDTNSQHHLADIIAFTQKAPGCN